MIKKTIFFIILIIVFIISCDNFGEPGYVPDWGPRNIKFTPGSGKPGDTITITGDDFLSKEEMEIYLTDRQEFIYRHNPFPLIKFNVNIYHDPEHQSTFVLEGTEVTEYLEFNTNKIVCKVPEGAKSGKIWVNGYYTAAFKELHHPSEEEFIVYDETGDIVR
ncbi:MAG TPA: IPT/TIG domain-containing protein [Spirochaetota bacterium]|nr:IPT/TIG domain-containing protein [Spirochaetota bacterium]HQF78679.1 IPT/TIG domain-containing protein [Spirochaetota bacterium]HQH31442.1 IPT/TIG domain-containing protein [Spirochaetota bacterium]HRU43684.1 IPT/TIG domain-containing protein [Spirochaetota bacterium]